MCSHHDPMNRLFRAVLSLQLKAATGADYPLGLHLSMIA
jgi:hypothetical protein